MSAIKQATRSTWRVVRIDEATDKAIETVERDLTREQAQAAQRSAPKVAGTYCVQEIEEVQS